MCTGTVRPAFCRHHFPLPQTFSACVTWCIAAKRQAQSGRSGPASNPWFAAHHQALEERAALETKVDTLDAQRNTLEARVEDLEGQRATLETRVQTMKEAAGAAAREAARLWEEMEQARADGARLTAAAKAEREVQAQELDSMKQVGSGLGSSRGLRHPLQLGRNGLKGIG